MARGRLPREGRSFGGCACFAFGRRLLAIRLRGTLLLAALLVALSTAAAVARTPAPSARLTRLAVLTLLTLLTLLARLTLTLLP
jgi:hypothetical protein